MGAAPLSLLSIDSSQYVDQNSPRNIFILGFGLYSGLAIPYWFTTYQTVCRCAT